MAQQSVLTNVDVAKANILAFNEKNWDKVRATITPTVVYDEVGTLRKVQGMNDVLATWRGWAEAFPDARARFDNEYVSGTTVVLELTWTGTHSGQLQTPNGEIEPSGKKISVRACQVIETTGDKVSAVRHYFDMTTLLRQLGAI
jgi:steroid delta-isomerase-like uncharacterized protein